MKRVLVTTDGSPESEAIMPLAAEIARGVGAEVHLLRVGDIPKEDGTVHTPLREPGSAPSYQAMSQGGAPPVLNTMPAERRDQAVERMEHEILEYLQSLSPAFKDISVQCHVRLDGDAAAAIIALAKELPADLIAMSTHGRGAVASVVQGSVATKVVRSGVAPVLLSRPPSVRA